MSEPILFGTQRDYAWNAWQTAYGVGDGQGAHEDEFKAWWELSLATQHWDSLKALMLAAWTAGVAAAAAKAPTFEAWWQEILDTQPVIGEK